MLGRPSWIVLKASLAAMIYLWEAFYCCQKMNRLPSQLLVLGYASPVPRPFPFLQLAVHPQTPQAKYYYFIIEHQKNISSPLISENTLLTSLIHPCKKGTLWHRLSTILHMHSPLRHSDC